MTLEEYVFMFWTARTATYADPDDGADALAVIRPPCQHILAKAKLPWTEREECHLRSCCLNYSSSWQMPFLLFWARRYCRSFPVTQKQQETLIAAAKRATKVRKRK